MASLLLIIIVFVFATDQAGAESRFPISYPTETICSRGALERMWFDEHTGHGRNMPQHWVMESSDLRFVGGGYDTVNWNLNFTTMKGVSWEDYELYNSNGVDGWIGKWQGKLSPITPPVYTADGMKIWLFEGRGEGHGFGQYQGLQEHFEVHQSALLYDTVAEALEENPCWTGYTWENEQVYVLQNNIPAYVTGRADD